MKNENSEEIVDKYQFLVYKLASKMKANYLEYEDLVQIGFMGLLKAIKNYQENENTNFLSYASKYIVYEIKKEIRKSSYYKVSDYLYKLANKINSVESNDIYKIANLTNESIENILFIKCNNMYTIEKIEDYNEIPSKELKIPIGLTKQEEDVYYMRIVYNYTQKEIGTILNISQSTVSRIIKSICEKLIN